MGIKVTVNSVPTTRVSINSIERNSIRSVGVSPSVPVNQLRNLLDVDASSLNNNETLVYDGASDKFVVKETPGVWRATDDLTNLNITNSLGVGTTASGTIGEIRAANNITAYYSSDIALKENIKNIEFP